jgi:hypothetical protein
MEKKMKKYQMVILTLAFSFLFVSCAHHPHDRYNTQIGAAVGAGTGALIGQAIGGNTESTLIGLAAGTIIGALVGNAVDQDYQAARDAAQYGKPVIYYDKSGHAVEAIPEETDDPNCYKLRKRIWEDGKLVKETVEEICNPSAPIVRYYPAPPPPAHYYNGWLGWPVFPSFFFHYGGPYHHGHYRGGHYRGGHYRGGHYRGGHYRRGPYRRGHYPYHRGWHHR